MEELKIKLANSQQESRSLLQDLRQLQDVHSQEMSQLSVSVVFFVLVIPATSTRKS